MSHNQNSNYIPNALDKIIKFIVILSSLLMLLVTLTVFAEVLSRYVFNFPIIYTSALTSLIFPWLIFLGSIAVTYNDEHLSITYFRELMPVKIQKILLVFSKFIMLLFTILMIKASYDLSQAVASQKIPLLNISKSWLHYSVVFSFIGMLLVIIFQIIMIVKNKSE